MVKIIRVILFLIAQPVLADATPQDFAFVADLSEEEQSLQRFDLPFAVLSKIERKDYGDIRVFNSQNQAVPFNITQLEPKTEQNIVYYDLRFFRLANNTRQNGGLQIELNERTAQFSFKSNNHPPQANYLIIENSHQSEGLQAIKLAWQQPDNAFSINVTLESSDDLQSWQSINTATLYALQYLESTLTQNTVILPNASHAKYLRLSFQPTNSFSLAIEKATGEYQIETLLERENWQTVSLKPGDSPNQWLFNTGSYVPVSKIGFEIPTTGLFFQGFLYSQDDSPAQNLPKPNRYSFKHDVKRALHRYPEQQTPKDYWQYQSTVTQYRLITDAGEIVSSPMTVSSTKDRQWKIMLEQPATLLPEQIPQIKIAWQPVVVTFLAQGNPPFRLFFGNAAVEPLNATLLSSVKGSPKTVNLVNIRTVDQVNKAVEARQINGQKVLLWLILCFGVLVMGLMAYRLYLRMNLKND